jgi:hypothetical protein
MIDSSGKRIYKRKTGRPYKYSTPDGQLDTQLIADKVDNYIQTATEQNRFSLAGLAIALDVDIETLALWVKGLTSEPKYDKQGNDISVYNSELSRAIKRAKTHILKWLTENSNSQRQSKDIFLLKNWFGFRDVQEKDITGDINLNIKLGEIDGLSK